MTQTMREPTIQTLGLGTVLDIFKNGSLPAEPAGLVDKVFGEGEQRGSLVISGANGIVGAGKTMQLGSRLHPFGVPVVALGSDEVAGFYSRSSGHLAPLRVDSPAEAARLKEVDSPVAGAASMDAGEDALAVETERVRYAEIDGTAIEGYLARHFETVDRRELASGTRTLYHLAPRG